MRLSLLFLILFAGAVSAQSFTKGDYQWVLGDPAPNMPLFNYQFMLDFNQTPTQIVPKLHFAIPFQLVQASICDSMGEVLIYTNGVSVANGDHEIIEGGDTLLLDSIEFTFSDGHIPIVQAALILSNPQNNGIYYLFHEERQICYDWIRQVNQLRIKEIHLTTIDMHANGGKGKVIEKSKVIAYRDSLFDNGKIIATRHANGRDWWVTIPQFYSTHITRFLVTPEGVLAQPDAVVDQSLLKSATTQAAFSPDGTKYASLIFSNIVEQKWYLAVMDFDRCSGLFSNQVVEEMDPWNFALFFSPNSRFLYRTHDEGKKISQYDMSVPNWLSTEVLVQEWDGTVSPFPTVFGYGHPAPDGKVYFVPGNGADVIHIIHKPNEKGLACQVEQNTPLPSYNNFTMPNFPNFRLGPMDGSPCDSLGINNHPMAKFRWEVPQWQQPLAVAFTDLSYFEPSTWSWDFGDGTISQDTNPVHIYSAPNVYQVCLTVSNINGIHTACNAFKLGVSGTGGEPDLGSTSPVIRNIYPNPAIQGVVDLVLDIPTDFKGFVVFRDVTGQLLLRDPVGSSGVHRVDVHDLNSGLVICTLESLEGRVYDAQKLTILK